MAYNQIPAVNAKGITIVDLSWNRAKGPWVERHYETKVIFASINPRWQTANKKRIVECFQSRIISSPHRYYQVMELSESGYCQDGLRPSHHKPAAPITPENRQTRRASHFFHDDLSRDNGSASDGSRGLPERIAGASSSFRHAKRCSRTDNGKYNRIRISDLLNDHNQTGDNKCKIQNCNRNFDSEIALKIHQARKHGAKTSTVCPICSARFTVPSGMRRHVCYLHNLLTIKVFRAIILLNIVVQASHSPVTALPFVLLWAPMVIYDVKFQFVTNTLTDIWHIFKNSFLFPAFPFDCFSILFFCFILNFVWRGSHTALIVMLLSFLISVFYIGFTNAFWLTPD